jgi:hypothetical protein
MWPSAAALWLPLVADTATETAAEPRRLMKNERTANDEEKQMKNSDGD